jgi:hypothetical protein
MTRLHPLFGMLICCLPFLAHCMTPAHPFSTTSPPRSEHSHSPRLASPLVFNPANAVRCTWPELLTPLALHTIRCSFFSLHHYPTPTATATPLCFAQKTTPHGHIPTPNFHHISPFFSLPPFPSLPSLSLPLPPLLSPTHYYNTPFPTQLHSPATHNEHSCFQRSHDISISLVNTISLPTPPIQFIPWFCDSISHTSTHLFFMITTHLWTSPSHTLPVGLNLLHPHQSATMTLPFESTVPHPSIYSLWLTSTHHKRHRICITVHLNPTSTPHPHPQRLLLPSLTHTPSHHLRTHPHHPFPNLFYTHIKVTDVPPISTIQGTRPWPLDKQHCFFREHARPTSCRHGPPSPD